RVELRLRQMPERIVVAQRVEAVLVLRLVRMRPVARADADVQERAGARARQRDVRSVVEPARVRERWSVEPGAAEAGDDAAGHEARRGLAIEDIEPPDLAA